MFHVPVSFKNNILTIVYKIFIRYSLVLKVPLAGGQKRLYNFYEII
ncbi:hypothetical protein SB48_HM08orf00250 [Heyndrickxia coagulans]|uniref:Uncharacterized protein n=1 Tax=Heyndrickxia coagulans TaxID=1398 RepID=A0AAN0T2X0_HEYCO|nr:hypothetical protein SB48_HM08orf00250 [Heyndrickxia coagulans]